MDNDSEHLPSPQDAPPQPELHASDQLIETLWDPAYWRQLCPNLHVSDDEFMARTGKPEMRFGLSDKRASSLHKQMSVDGFYTVEPNELPWAVPLRELAIGIVQLLQYGWPATFIYVYDEAWAMAHQLSALIARTSNNVLVGDFYAWHVDPRRSQRGWGPHRDRMGSPPTSFHADGTPMLCTTWVACTNATTENSCLYVVPATADPEYRTGDTPGKDVLAQIFATPDGFQDICALPRPAGGLITFGHRVIHWGSAGRKPCCGREIPPRIAMSFVHGSSTFEKPYISHEMLPFPPVPVRVAFVAAQIICYAHQAPPPSGRGKLFFRMYTAQKEHFGADYQGKVEWLYHCRQPPKQVQLRATKENKQVAPDGAKQSKPRPSEEEIARRRREAEEKRRQQDDGGNRGGKERRKKAEKDVDRERAMVVEREGPVALVADSEEVFQSMFTAEGDAELEAKMVVYNPDM